MTLAEFWPQCLRLLASELSDKQFRMAIEPLTVGEEDGVWAVYAKTQFNANLLRSQYAAKLREARELLAPDAPELLIKVGSGVRYEMAADSGSLNVAAAVGIETDDNDSPTEKPHTEIESAIAGETQSAADSQAAANIQAVSALDIVHSRMSNLRSGKSAAAEAAAPAAADEAPAAASPIEKAKAADSKKLRYEQTQLNPDYTFETLVEGKGNNLAAAIAKGIAEKPGDSQSNPFFIYGSTGLGKTHLAQAIGNELLANHPNTSVRYIHSNDYVKSFMAAARHKTWDSFKQQYLHYDLLIIDDIQFIQGKDRTMEEFFILFEHFHNRGQQIILTCDQLPRSLPQMDERLISRFSWGMTAQIEPPELEMRVLILERKAKAIGLPIEEDAAYYIANNIKSSVRDLEGALNSVAARCKFEKRASIDLDAATNGLRDIIASNYKPITPEGIIQTVTDFYRLRAGEITGKRRIKGIAHPRQMAMALVKELTTLSLPAIGKAFNRDHSTVMHAVKTIAERRQSDPDINKDYEKLTVLIK